MATKKAANDGDRLLTLAELAKYLHLNERTVLKLVTAKKIPGVLIDKQWRFKRSTIDGWLEQQLTGESDTESNIGEVVDGMSVPLADVLPEEAIITDLRAGDAIGVIEEMAARAYTHGWLADKPWFVGAVVERESLASTAMEGGVAFLHTRARDQGKIARPFITIGRHYQGVDFGAPDGKPTYLFFMLGLKYDRLHLPILGRLARAMRNPRTIAKLRSMTSATKMRALLFKEDEQARTSSRPAPVAYQEAQPKLDRQMRLRTIMRLTAQRKTDDTKEAKKPGGRTRKAAAATKAAGKSKSASAAPGSKTKSTPSSKSKSTPSSKTRAAASKKPAAARKASPRKAPAKKPPAGKTAEKKAPAKKPPARKTSSKKPATGTSRSRK
jgi:excisionase family DNA binding protein